MPKPYPLKNIFVIQALYVLGFVFGVIAAACLYGYGREVVLSFGAADKSLLFWYLPILFIGVFAFWTSVLCLVFGYRRHKKSKE